ncbi:MAG: hypothetical protein GPJ54_06300 [Candidatus Heimdallarchaeota archaeon]|nr:hypothetical protein [Candidatus Heimdallarchaeota archaeon]
MSEEDFLGRVIDPGFQSHYFDLCDVCGKQTANWIETTQTNNVSEIRVTCNDCHEEYLNRLNQTPEIDNEGEFELYDQVSEENEDITPVERPEWMQDFIDEAQEDGIIEKIGGSEEAVSNIEILEELTEESEIEDETTQIDVLNQTTNDFIEKSNIENNSTQYEDSTQIPDDPIVLASWSGEFVKEALFGQDPENWLDEHQAFVVENIESTIVTLAKLSENQVSNVKITAIHCLNSMVRRHPETKYNVIDSLKNFIDDIDEMVVNYAQETINSIK